MGIDGCEKINFLSNYGRIVFRRSMMVSDMEEVHLNPVSCVDIRHVFMMSRTCSLGVKPLYLLYRLYVSSIAKQFEVCHRKLNSLAICQRAGTEFPLFFLSVQIDFRDSATHITVDEAKDDFQVKSSKPVGEEESLQGIVMGAFVSNDRQFYHNKFRYVWIEN